MSPTETSSSTRREIAVEIPVEEVARETNSLIQKYQKLARIPGFRRGHVPASVIRQRFAEDLKSDVVEALVPRYFRKEADKQGLIPVSQPQVTDLHLKDNEPLRFKASFEVMPEIKVDGYKELRAEKPEVTVTDEEVEQSLNGLREQQATFTPWKAGRWPMEITPRYRSMANPGTAAKDGTSRSTWMKCWSKSRARTPCRNSPRICAEHRPATNAYSK